MGGGLVRRRLLRRLRIELVFYPAPPRGLTWASQSIGSAGMHSVRSVCSIWHILFPEGAPARMGADLLRRASMREQLSATIDICATLRKKLASFWAHAVRAWVAAPCGASGIFSRVSRPRIVPSAHHLRRACGNHDSTRDRDVRKTARVL